MRIKKTNTIHESYEAREQLYINYIHILMVETDKALYISKDRGKNLTTVSNCIR